MRALGQIAKEIVADLQPRRLNREDRWRLESQVTELIQGAGRFHLEALLDLLLDVEADLVKRRKVSRRRQHIVDSIYAWHCGPWRL